MEQDLPDATPLMDADDIERALLGRPASMRRSEISQDVEVTPGSARRFWHALGFQIVEDFYYTINGAMNHPNANQIEPVAQMMFVRGVLCGLWSHAAYTAVASFGIGNFVVRRDTPLAQRFFIAAAALIFAWSLHAFWNSPFLSKLTEGTLIFFYFPLKGLPVLLAALLIWRMVSREDAHGY